MASDRDRPARRDARAATATATATATAHEEAASRRDRADSPAEDGRAAAAPDADVVQFPGNTPHEDDVPKPRAKGHAKRDPATKTTTAKPDRDPARRSDIDEWGRSERARRLLRQLSSPLYDHWFRVEWEGLDKIPLTGGALLIGNHAGAIPPDAAMVMHGIEKELGRPVYGLADNWFRTVPIVGTLWSRGGGVPAHPENAHRLLHDQGQLVLVFPEGVKGPSKQMTERYRLRRFGRGGFVETAMRAGVPVVPIAIVGAEESMPILHKFRSTARMLRVPYLPLTVNHLLLGPVLGTVTYLPAKFRFRVLDPVHFDVEPGRERYPRGSVMDAVEEIRRDLQDNIYDLLAKRRSIWLG